MSLAAIVAAVLAWLLMRSGRVFAAGAAAVIAVGLLAEAWRRED